MKQQSDPRLHNDFEVEKQWAEQAGKYAESFEMILLRTKPENLIKFRFTPNDDKLYERFKQLFPKLNVELLNVDQLKSQKAKLDWYNFLESNKHLCKDYNFGSLIRVNCLEKFSETNATVVPRLQFYCIELQRFRDGANAKFLEKFATAQAPIQVEVKTLEEVDNAPKTEEQNALIARIMAQAKEGVVK